MTVASDLIKRMEEETGQRIDDNDGDNLAMVGLFGAVARIMGETPPSYRERDNVAAGVLIRHRMTARYRVEQENKQLIASLLSSGLSSDDLMAFSGGKFRNCEDTDKKLAATLEIEFYRADTELSFYEFLRSCSVTEARIRDLFPGIEIAQIKKGDR